MEYYGNTLCISHGELTAGIMTESNLKLLRHRGKLQQVRRACYDTPALFAVESLPLKYRTEVYRRYPDLQEKADSKPFMDTITPDGMAMQFYAEYVLSDGRHLPPEKQAEYSNNCAIMNAFRHCIEMSNSHRLRQSKPKLNKTEFWRKAAAALPRLADRFPHSLPESDRRLQRKFNDYLRDGYVCFISKKFQNTNAAKVDDDIKESVLVQLIGHHNNLDNAAIAKLYNAVANQQDWKPITASAVAVWRDKLDLVTAAGRLGATNFRNTKSMQVKRKRPTAPFLMWTLDGWDVELLYQDTKTDSKGHSVTTYCNRLTLEVVLDPCCNYPIGYAIGTHETPALIAEALRNAAKHSEELFGVMLRANQIQCDHYALKAMTPLYNVMGAKLTPARVKNAKSKVVEPYFSYLNKKYGKLFNNWSGYGITTDPSKQPNSEALNMQRHRFPDEAGVRQQIEKIIQMERQCKVERFRKMMDNLPAECRLPLSREQYLLHFGAETGYKNAIEGSGLRPTLLGMKRDYDCFDMRFRQYAGTRWTVKYDPDNLHEVLAVSEDGTLHFMLTEKYVQPMALADRKEGDAAELQRVQDFNRQMEQYITDRRTLAYEKTEQLISGNPQLDNILGRLLICDSRGQHKLPKAQQRLKAQEVEAVEVPIIPQGAAASDKDDYSIF
nr:MAG TPA: transposase [Caudoviricetes sp.]